MLVCVLFRKPVQDVMKVNVDPERQYRKAHHPQKRISIDIHFETRKASIKYSCSELKRPESEAHEVEKIELNAIISNV